MKLISLRALMLAFVFSGTASAVDTPPTVPALLKQEEVESYPLTLEAGKLVARIPLLDPTQQVKPVALFAMRGEKEAVKHWAGSPDIDPDGAAITISFTPAESPGVATYKALLSFQSAGKDATRVLVKLVRPRPILRIQNASITLDKRGDAQPSATVLIEETGGVAPAEWTFKQVPDKCGADDGQFIVPALHSLKAGELGEMNLKTKGDFPLGESKGKLLLLAPLLQTMENNVVKSSGYAEITYTVMNRLPLVWVLLPVVLGALIGLVVRILLPRGRERISALLAASQTLQSLRLEIDRTPDKGFCDAVEPKWKELRDAAKKVGDSAWAPITTLTKRTEEASAALTDAQNKLKTKHEEVTANIDACHKAVSPVWDLPPAVAELTRDITERMDRAVASVARRDPTTAGMIMEECEGEPLRLLNDSATQWRDAADAYLAELSRRKPTLDADASTQFDAAVTAWGTKRDAFTKGESWAGARALLMHLDDVRKLVKTRIQDVLANGGAAVVETAISVLAQADAFEVLRLQIHADVLEAISDFDDPRAHPDRPRRRQSAQVKAWSDTLLPLTLEASRSEVTAALQTNPPGWQAAIDVTKRSPDPDAVQPQSRAATSAARVFAALSASAARGGASFKVAPAAEGTTDMAGATSSFGLGRIDPPRGTEAERIDLDRVDKSAAFFQTFLLAIIYLAGVVLYYHDSGKWIGNWPQLAAIFLGAVAVDFSGEALKTTALNFGSAVSALWKLKAPAS